MRGKLAKRLRRIAYGDTNPRERQYAMQTVEKDGKPVLYGCVYADGLRHLYQQLKEGQR